MMSQLQAEDLCVTVDSPMFIEKRNSSLMQILTQDLGLNAKLVSIKAIQGKSAKVTVIHSNDKTEKVAAGSFLKPNDHLITEAGQKVVLVTFVPGKDYVVCESSEVVIHTFSEDPAEPVATALRSSGKCTQDEIKDYPN